MSEIKRKWDILSKEQKNYFVSELIHFYKTERGEEIGILAAEDLLNFFLKKMGTFLYNAALDDAKSFLKTRFVDIELDLDSMQKNDPF